MGFPPGQGRRPSARLSIHRPMPLSDSGAVATRCRWETSSPDATYAGHRLADHGPPRSGRTDMTTFGWDASHYDRPLPNGILTRANNAGTAFFRPTLAAG